MGLRGPVPAREGELARPRSRKGGDQQEVTHGVAREAVIPEPDPEWHEIARMVWDSLLTSGQSDFYQSSDWAIAYSLMDDLSHYKNPTISKEGEPYHKRSGQMLQTIMTALSNLLVTEADRRRVRVELEKPPADTTSAAVLAIADYQSDLGVTEDDFEE